ncbi:MAG: hypothetical protein EXX96DRAFT_316334 [Benjaminiella poitrasii]|nr:MAG: hypothetical protein EXX96DRAFT_316334 [Benjaminiella poitrasii]
MTSSSSNNNTKILAEKEEFHPTVLSQSFNTLFSPSSTYYFWDTLMQQDQTYNTFAKPIGELSPDSYHESNPAVLPIGAPRMAIHDLITGPTLDSSLQFMLFMNHNVIKDDVFLAQPSTTTLSRDVLLYPNSSSSSLDHDDNASLSSHSSLSSSQHSDKLTSPCLSPVTSPTVFLYNHEPLFDGGIIEEEQEKTSDSLLTTEEDEEEYDDLSSVVTAESANTLDNHTSQQQTNLGRLSSSGSSNDLDWFKLLDAFHADVACDLPPSIDTSSKETIKLEETQDAHSQFSMDDHFSIMAEPVLKKRKRRTKNQLATSSNKKRLSCAENEDDDIIKSSTLTKNNVRPNPRQKRRKKTSQKKSGKKHGADSVVSGVKKKSTSSSVQVKHKEDNTDQEVKDTFRGGQMIEPITEDDTKTVFQHLTEAGIDWCRYCGTTEGVNWRPGPWGKRTLCNKHGCDYKGYGLASRLPRLDLSAFTNERLEDRLRPVVQYFCIVCQSPEQKDKENRLVLCDGGCSRAYHQHCHTPVITVNPVSDSVHWYCSASCKENLVELPRKHTPLMHLLPKSLKKKKVQST